MSDKPILYLTIGFPGSGKTYFSERLANDYKLFHLNADRLRLEMFDTPSYAADEHRVVFRTMDYIAEELLKRGVGVIYDANTNKRIHREQKYAMAKAHGASAQLLWFRTPVNVALERISSRGNTKYYRKITPEVLHQLKDELEAPENEPVIELDGMGSYEEQVRKLGL